MAEASERQNQPQLIVEDTGQVFILGQDLVTIGRKSGNTIVLGNDLKTSRHHATIAWDEDKDAYIVYDVGSSNGTFVNRERLTEPYILQNNDAIEVGDTTFIVKIPLVDTQPSISKPVGEVTENLASPRQDSEMTMMRVHTPPPSNNPYVGPRTFTSEESDRFFGRETEAGELLSLVISERLVQFYAQSGAGKSSLINTRLIPQLRESGLAVLPVGRVSGELPEGVDEVDNIYIFNLLLSLDESDGNPKRFIDMQLTDFLRNLTSLDSIHYYYDDTLETNEYELGDDGQLEEVFEETPYVLILDQFEEIITTHPARWEDREGFFQQLEQAMLDDPLLWVVLTMREDYIAPLEPYKHLLTNNLRAKYYMQRMGYEAALEAVKNPADRYGRPFADGVAESLVDNLRQIRVQNPQSPGELEIRPGQFIEPVQLQVVCFQMWENLKSRPLDYITDRDLKELGNVDTALGQFYEKALERVIKQTDVSEIEIRNWFETKLITEAGTRGTVYQGTDFTGGIPNKAVTLLANEYLVRAEVKAGGTWYELVHDRLVYPILQANQMWKLDQPIIQLAHNWIEDRRNPDRLLQTQQLGVALEGNWQSLGEEVEEYIVASQRAQLARDEELRQERERARQLEIEQARALAEAQRERAEEQAKATERLRKRFWMLLFLAVVAGFFALFAGFLTWLTIREQAETQAALSTAQAVATLAEDNAAEARKIREGQRATEEAFIAVQVEAIQDQGVEDLNATAQSIEATTTTAAQTAAARLTAEAASEATSVVGTNVPVPTTPSSSPTGTYEPPTITPLPTATATATPDVAATDVTQSLLAELNIIRIAQTRVAERVEVIATDSQEQGCRVAPDPTFRDIWDMNQDTLGCPVQAEPIAGAYAEQTFENGFMLWSQILEQFFVTIGSATSGTWQLYSRGDFPDDAAGCKPTYLTDNSELVQPVSGFGAIWCTWPELQREIGYGLAQEYAVSNNLVQEFEGGFIIRNSFGLTYILFNDPMVYESVR